MTPKSASPARPTLRTAPTQATAADRQGIDDDIDVYLLDAGLPPRPRGYVWMIRVPDAHTLPEAWLTSTPESFELQDPSRTQSSCGQYSRPLSANSTPGAADLYRSLGMGLEVLDGLIGCSLSHRSAGVSLAP